VRKSVGLREAFKDYKYKYPVNHRFHCDNISIYRGILEEYNMLISNLMIETGYTKDNRHGMGSHYICKFKLKDKKQIDFGHYRKTKEVRIHNNLHTNNVVARWMWSKYNMMVKNVDLYKFKSTRTNNRNLAKFIKKEGIDRYRDTRFLR